MDATQVKYFQFSMKNLKIKCEFSIEILVSFAGDYIDDAIAFKWDSSTSLTVSARSVAKMMEDKYKMITSSRSDNIEKIM